MRTRWKICKWPKLDTVWGAVARSVWSLQSHDTTLFKIQCEGIKAGPTGQHVLWSVPVSDETWPDYPEGNKNIVAVLQGWCKHRPSHPKSLTQPVHASPWRHWTCDWKKYVLCMFFSCNLKLLHEENGALCYLLHCLPQTHQIITLWRDHPKSFPTTQIWRRVGDVKEKRSHLRELQSF